MSSGPSAARRSAIARCGVIGIARRSRRRRRAPRGARSGGRRGRGSRGTRGARRRRGRRSPRGRTAASSRRSEPSMSPISSTSGRYCGVDLGRLGVDVDDPLAAVGVPARTARTRRGRSRRRSRGRPGRSPVSTWSRAWSPTAISERCDRSSIAPLPMNVAATGHVEARGRTPAAPPRRAAGGRRCRRGRAAAATRRSGRRRGRSPRRSARGSRSCRAAAAATVVARDGHRREVLGQLDVGRAGLLERRDAGRPCARSRGSPRPARRGCSTS